MEVTKAVEPLKLKVFVDDITDLSEGRNKELSSIAEQVVRAMRMEAVDHGSRKRSREQGHRAMQLLGGEVSGEGVGLANRVKTLGDDIILFSHSKTSLEVMIDDWRDAFAWAALEVGLDKTHWSNAAPLLDDPHRFAALP